MSAARGEPVARSAAGVLRSARAAVDLADLDARIVACRACPRLVAWREEVAAAPRRAFADQIYWGRPIPGFGDAHPWLLVLGLAPAAHGANRTGRVFTGDRSGDWLFAALHRAGWASQATSEHVADGQVLSGVRILAPVRCAPPANRPTPLERDTCAPWTDRELALTGERLRVVLALGAFAWAAALSVLERAGWAVPSPRPRFGHGRHVELPARDPGPVAGRAPVVLLGSYHLSQQNTFTGRLTEAMLDEVLATAAELGGSGSVVDSPLQL